MEETVREGDWIVLQSIDISKDLTFVRYYPNRTVKVGGRKFRLSELPTPKFGCRVDFAVKSQENESQQRQQAEEAAYGETTNYNCDELIGSETSFTAQDIERLRKAGIVGEDLVKLLSQKNPSFSKLSRYAQEKYISRKRRKHMVSVLVQKPTCCLLCEWYLKKNPEAILRLSPVSVGLVLRLANIVVESKVLIFEDTLGLLCASVAERTQQRVFITTIFEGEHPPGLELLDFFPSLVEWRRTPRFIVCPMNMLTLLYSEEERDGFPLSFRKDTRFLFQKSDSDIFASDVSLTKDSNKYYRPIVGQLKQTLREGFNSLIITCREPTWEKIILLISQLVPNGSFAVYHYSSSYLSELHYMLLKCPLVIAIQLEECSQLEHQMISGRSHPNIYWSYYVIFQKPHTASLLAAFLGLIVYLAWRNEQGTDTVSNVIQGILCSCLPLLIYGILQFRDGFFQRPHPAVWRLVMGISLLYLMFLVFLLFQNVSDARKIIGYMDPLNAGQPLPDRSYGEDCRLWTPDNPEGSLVNLTSALDAFVVAHTLGWFVKALMIRDRIVLWLASALFELLEYLLKGMLPNFNECWWDSIILDLLCCNLVGIELGLVACKVLQTKKYSWRGDGAVSKKYFWRELIGTLGPSSFDKLHWPIFGSLRHFVACSLVIFILEVADLNAFFLKAILFSKCKGILPVSSRSYLSTFRKSSLDFGGHVNRRIVHFH
ncbi:Phosphatidylserine synthase 2 [Galdieria sulphuraria]|nr:Phosphatidylserine synthase 2 [Galdieria sulphuraria]